MCVAPCHVCPWQGAFQRRSTPGIYKRGVRAETIVTTFAALIASLGLPAVAKPAAYLPGAATDFAGAAPRDHKS